MGERSLKCVPAGGTQSGDLVNSAVSGHIHSMSMYPFIYLIWKYVLWYCNRHIRKMTNQTAGCLFQSRVQF